MAWSVDRLGSSLQDLVGFLSDTTTPAGKAMFGMLGVFAEFERSKAAFRASLDGYRAWAARDF